MNYTENGVAAAVSMAAVTQAAKITYSDYATAASYVEPAIAKPLKVVGVTVAGVAVTFSAPVLATNANAVIAAIRGAIGAQFQFARAVTFNYVIAAANSENSFVACSVFGASAAIESLQLLKNDVTAFDLDFTEL
jgi:hypothetical protein